MSARAPECSRPGCRRFTRDASGRCFHHRGEKTGGPAVFLAPHPDPPGLGLIELPELIESTPVFSTNEDGSRLEQWLHRNELHRVGGPAATYYRPDGTVEIEEWWTRGNLDRLDGPALVEYSVVAHEPVREEWWIEHVRYPHGAAAVPSVLGSWPKSRATVELAHSPYRALLEDGFDAPTILSALGDGVRSVEGIRGLLAGAPIEWAQAFEDGLGE